MKTTNKSKSAALKKFSAILLAAASCAASVLVSSSAPAKTLDRIVAVVNDEIITEVELDRAVEKRGRAAAQYSALRQDVLNSLIDEVVFRQLMAKSAIEVSDDDLARAIAGVLHSNRMTLAQLKAETSSKGITYEEYKNEIRGEIRRIKFINQVIGPQVKITDQDLRDYYQRNQERFRGSHSAHISEILLPLSGLTTQEEFENVRDAALSIVAKAKKGKGLDKLVEQYSSGMPSIKGGDLGMVNLRDLPQPVAEEVRKMRAGDVSNPIFVGDALVIVKVVALPELSAKDFDRLRDVIYESVYDERIDETLRNYLMRERQRAFIEIR